MSDSPRVPREARRALRVRFWGTRGSIPAPGPDTVRYGGNTPCITVSSGANPPLIFDAGTGIRALGTTLGVDPNEQIELFLSHTHWDHIQGLPFFAPLFNPGARIRIWGVDEPAGSLEGTMRALMSPNVFPVRFDDLGASVEFRRPPFDGTLVHGLTIRAFAVHHPGGAVGYRIEAPEGLTVVYVPDNELHGSEAEKRSRRAAMVEACRGATFLIHDSTYTPEESSDYLGWGHSTTDDALRLAIDAGAQRLVLFHHAPHRTDAEIDAMVASSVVHAAGRVEVLAAAEGLELVLD